MVDFYNKINPNDSKSVRIRYTAPTDATQKTTLETRLEQLETLFDTKHIFQIHIQTYDDHVFIIQRNKNNELAVYDEEGNELEAKTVQDIIVDSSSNLVNPNICAFLAAYADEQSQIQENSILLMRTTDCEIPEDLAGTSKKAWIKLISNYILAIQEAASEAEATRLTNELNALLDKAPSEITVDELTTDDNTSAATDIKAYVKEKTDAAIAVAKKLDTKKALLLEKLPTLAANDISALAAALDLPWPEESSLTLNESNVLSSSEIDTIKCDPQVAAQILLQAITKCPGSFSFPTAPAVLLALSKALPPNQRIISFKEGNTDKYMLVEKQKDGSYKPVSDEYKDYKVELKDGQLKVTLKDKDTVDADLVVDHQWEFFSSLNQNGYEIYKRLWEDDKLTREEATDTNNKGFGFTNISYNWFSSRGMIRSEGDAAITDKDLESVRNDHIAIVCSGFPPEKHDAVIQAYAHAKTEFISVGVKEATENIMGDKEHINGTDALALVDEGSKEFAKGAIKNITGYEPGSAVLNKEQVQAYVACMVFMKTMAEAELGRDKAPFADYKGQVSYSEVKDTYLLSDADNVLKFLKGEKVGEAKGKDGEKAEENDKLRAYIKENFDDEKVPGKEGQETTVFKLKEGKDETTVRNGMLALLDDYKKDPKKQFSILSFMAQVFPNQLEDKDLPAVEAVLNNLQGEYAQKGEEMPEQMFIYVVGNPLDNSFEPLMGKLFKDKTKPTKLTYQFDKLKGLYEARLTEKPDDQKAKIKLATVVYNKVLRIQEELAKKTEPAAAATTAKIRKEIDEAEKIATDCLKKEEAARTEPTTDEIDTLLDESADSRSTDKEKEILSSLREAVIINLLKSPDETDRKKGEELLTGLLSSYDKPQKKKLLQAVYMTAYQLGNENKEKKEVKLIEAQIALYKKAVDIMESMGVKEETIDLSAAKQKGEDKGPGPQNVTVKGIRDTIKLLAAAQKADGEQPKDPNVLKDEKKGDKKDKIKSKDKTEKTDSKGAAAKPGDEKTSENYSKAKGIAAKATKKGTSADAIKKAAEEINGLGLTADEKNKLKGSLPSIEEGRLLRGKIK